MDSNLNIYETHCSGVKVFYADVSKLDTEKEYPLISIYRREKILKLKSDKNKKLSLGAELLLIYALKKYYKDIMLPLEFSFGKYGKPEIPGIQFSLAHASDVAVCAVSDKAVGVDIERIDRKSDRVAKRAFSENEQKFEFVYIWTRKEAAVKADGGGIALGLSDIDVTKDFVTINGKSYRIISIKPEITGYYVALCVQSDVD